jgi:hypothetical protein
MSDVNRREVLARAVAIVAAAAVPLPSPTVAEEEMLGCGWMDDAFKAMLRAFEPCVSS